MLKYVLFYLIFCAVVFSCAQINYSRLKGVYLDDKQTTLKLREDGGYELEMNQISTKVSGNYKTKGNKLILEIDKTEYKPYTVEIPPQTRIDGYEFMIRGKDWGGLSGAHCKIVSDGQIVQEGFSEKRGIVNFDYIETGTLVIAIMGWEKAEIDLSEVTVRSIMITLDREKFKESITSYEFLIGNDVLHGVGDIEDWNLKKKM